MFHSVKSRIAATFLVALLVVVIPLSVAAYLFLHWYEHGKTDDEGVAAAQTAAIMFDYAVDNEIDFTDAEQYEEFRSLLRGVCKEYGMAYLYAYECDVENNKITYLACVASNDQDDALVKRSYGYGVVLSKEFTSVELDALSGRSPKKAIQYDNALGYTLDWVSPVPVKEGNVLAGASYLVNAQRTRVFQSTLSVLIPFVVSLALIYIVQLSIMRRYLFDPIATIADRMRTFSVDHTTDFAPIDVKSNDEMGEIAEAFETMATKITEYVDSIERLTEERVQANVELDVARRIQLGMVPSTTKLTGDGFAVSALSRPARAVGGDFYDAIALSDGRIAVVVGDVSEKGIAAAMFMVMIKTMIRDAFKTGQEPAEALRHVNASICAENPEGMFVTVFACVFDPATGELRYANAGHMPPLVIDTGVHALDMDPGVLLGLFDDANLTECTMQLEPDQAVLLYTDGATEAVDADKRLLGKDELMKRLAARCPYESASEIVDATDIIVDEFTANCEQFDDLTLVALMRSRGKEEPGIPANAVEVKPDIASFKLMRDDIFATDADEVLKRRACLICEEIFVNIVTHSNTTKIWYAVENEHSNLLRITLADDGPQFDPTTATPIEREFEHLDKGGMGVGLVCHLASSIRYTRAGDRNILFVKICD